MRYAAITFLLLALVTCGAKRAHAKRSNSPAIELNQKLTSDYMDRETRRLEAILELAPTKSQATANVSNPQPFCDEFQKWYDDADSLDPRAAGLVVANCKAKAGCLRTWSGVNATCDFQRIEDDAP